MHLARRLSLPLVFLVAACAGDLTLPIAPAQPVRDVLVTVEVPGPCISNICGPTSFYDPRHLGVVRIANGGTATAWIPACGLGPVVTVQKFVHGEWLTEAVPAIACAVTPGPIVVQPGESFATNRFFESGTFRVTVGVAGAEDLHDVELATSASFQVR
jgi:hypothetical protein